MATPRVNRPHLPRAKRAPRGAAERIEKLAATGHSVVGIARGLNVAKEVVARWVDEDPAIAEALARGRESERFVLHNVLYRAAKRGNIVAAMFLLKARHGYREGDQSDTGNKVSITFQLPGALTPEQFATVIEFPREATDKNLPLPGKSLTRS